jgi:hypothetical protein
VARKPKRDLAWYSTPRKVGPIENLISFALLALVRLTTRRPPERRDD